METLQHSIEIPPGLAGRRLDQALAELFPDYSRSRIKAWILAGRVALEGETAAPRTRVAAGQRVDLRPVLDAQVMDHPEAMDLSILYQDDDVLVIDKPAGLVVHPGAGHRGGTLINGLLHHDPGLAALPRSGLIHRLDKDTSGLLLVARTVAAHTRLVRDLEERRIMREYRAVCVGRLTAGGSVRAPIGRHPTHRTRMAVTDRGRPAVTHYRVLARFAAHSLLAVRLETGRTHQIRVHLAHIRHPLVGDPDYGGRLVVPAGARPELADALRAFHRQALHASRLAFPHPVKRHQVELTAPFPADLLGLLRALDESGQPVSHFEQLQWPEAGPRWN